MRRLVCACALAVLPLATSVAASAAPAIHDAYVEDYNATESFAAGQGEPCVPWAGAFHEVRSGEVKLVTISSGPHTGEVRLTGAIDGFIEYIPVDSSLPTYSGSYREKFAAFLYELSFDDDAERISQFHLRGVLHGTDGSSLTAVMSGKVTINANGAVQVDRFEFTCD
jgi:hypothetical protein